MIVGRDWHEDGGGVYRQGGVAMSGICVVTCPWIVSTMGRMKHGEQRDQDLPIMIRDPDPLVQMMVKHSFAPFQSRVKDPIRYKAAMRGVYWILYILCPLIVLDLLACPAQRRGTDGRGAAERSRG